MSDKTQTESQTLNMDSFNPKKSELIALAEKHKAATEIEIIDKETYEQVHQAQIVLRDARNAIKEQGLAIRESANKFIKQVTTAEKELLEIIVPTENILIAKKDAFKKKEEDEKRKAEIKKAQEEAAEKARKETEDRMKKEKEDADRKKKEEEEAEKARKEEEERKLERGRKYQEFLTQIGFKKEEEHLWMVDDTEEGRVFYKRVGVFPKK